MKLRSVVVNERSQTQKVIYHLISFMWKLRKGKTIKIESRLLVARGQKWRKRLQRNVVFCSTNTYDIIIFWDLNKLDFQNPMGILRPSTKHLGEEGKHSYSQCPFTYLSPLPSHFSPASSLLFLWFPPCFTLSEKPNLLFDYYFYIYINQLSSNFVLLSLKPATMASPFLEKLK